MGKLLIIDDDILLVNSITDRIEYDLPDLKFSYVKTGSDGLRAIRETDINVVILDMMLPLGTEISLPIEQPDLMYGVFILRKIREKRPDLFVICYTVVNDSSLKKQIMDIPNTKYFCKLKENTFNDMFKELERFTN
jgi:DNA-binding NarL/FixJ family response regulator